MRWTILMWLAVLPSSISCSADSDAPSDPAADASADNADTADDPDPGDVAAADTNGSDADPLPVDVGDVECTEKYGKACQDNTVLWVDSCGRPGVVFEICGADRTCVGGGCQEICDSQAQQKCQGGNLFWFDSCGNVETVAQACPQWCENDACVEGALDGTWVLTAQPPKMLLGAVGLVEYGARTATVVITGSEVTATIDVASPKAIYKGTIDGQKLTLTAEWTEPGPPALEHTTTLQVQLTGAAEFHGVETDVVTSEGSPQGKLVWNVTGIKQ